MSTATGTTSAPEPAGASTAPLDIDWDTAGRWAGRLASPGPTGSRSELAATVAELHEVAARARPLALRASRLSGALEAAQGTAAAPAQVLVVDRAGWARAAAHSFSALAAGPGTTPGTAASAGGPGAAVGRPGGLRGVPATAQAAGILGLLAGRVLGQFDPFGPHAPPGGRLLVVAPNVLHTERALRADPADFRLWVCLHEQTHALQFAAAPWLVEHLRAQVTALVEDLAGTSAGQELASAVSRGLRALRSDGDEDDAGLLDAVLEPSQRAQLDRITAVMSVLEGHADVTMDAVGRRTIPTVRQLRTRFDARRNTATGVDRLLRRLIGMDAKLAQYRRGAAFVRAVRRSAGRHGLDPFWSGPEALPDLREIADPRAWVRRVHG